MKNEIRSIFKKFLKEQCEPLLPQFRSVKKKIYILAYSADDEVHEKRALTFIKDLQSLLGDDKVLCDAYTMSPTDRISSYQQQLPTCDLIIILATKKLIAAYEAESKDRLNSAISLAYHHLMSHKNDAICYYLEKVEKGDDINKLFPLFLQDWNPLYIGDEISYSKQFCNLLTVLLPGNAKLKEEVNKCNKEISKQLKGSKSIGSDNKIVSPIQTIGSTQQSLLKQEEIITPSYQNTLSFTTKSASELALLFGIEVDGDYSQLQWSALHQACYKRNEEAILQILNGANSDPNLNINGLDKNGNTPLHLLLADKAADSAKIIELLINKGADCLIANSKGITPLHLAILNGQQAVMELFCQKVNSRRDQEFLKRIITFIYDINCSRLFDLKKILSLPIQEYKNLDDVAKNNLLDNTVCKLLRIECISYEMFHYLALLRSRAGMITKTAQAFQVVNEKKDGTKIIKMIAPFLEGEVLEGWDVVNFLATRVRFFIQILSKLSNGMLDDDDKPPTEIPIDVAKELLYNQINTAVETLKIYIVNLQLKFLKNQPYKNIFKSSFIRILASKIGNLVEGEQFYCPTGYLFSTKFMGNNSSGHTLYVGFKRTTPNNKYISIRVDNLLRKDLEEFNQQPKIYQELKDGKLQDKIKYPPRLVKLVPIQDFIMQKESALQYLDQLLEATYLERANALPKIYTYPTKIDTVGDMLAEKIIATTEQWPGQNKQDVGNCVVKNYNMGLLFGFFKKTSEIETGRDLYTWLLKQERKLLVEKLRSEYKITLT